MRWAGLLVLCSCRFTPLEVYDASAGGGGGGGGTTDAAHHSDAAADAAAPFCDPNDATLIACYAFEGVVADGSPHHLDPDITDNVTYGSGVVGRALVVGQTTEVDVAENAIFGASALTIEAWINPAQIPSSRGGILDCDGRYGFFLYSDANLECFAAGTGIAGPIATNTWTHVACTQDGSTVRVYVNGQLAGSAAAGTMSLTGSKTGITLGGNNPPNGGNPLGGSLDQLRLYSGARTAAQICADSGSAGC